MRLKGISVVVTLALVLLISSVAAVVLVLFFSFTKSGATLINPDIEIGEEISFKSGDIAITGSLIKPETNQKVPAIIGVSGSGAFSYRRNWENEDKFVLWRGVSEIFVDEGLAVLLLEKRGINKSEGDWKKSSFYDRAQDVYSAIKYLQERDDIITDKIGLCGHSQGGWIVQLVAAQHPEDIDFVVNLAGASISVKEQVLDDIRHDFECQDLSEEKIERKMAWENFKLNLYIAISKLIKIGYGSRIYDYDPKDVAPKIRAPILSIYGENDYLVLAEKNARLLEEGLKKGENQNYQIVILPKANHGFLYTDDICRRSDANEFVPEFVDALTSWKHWDTLK